jgi:hypothetical protein
MAKGKVNAARKRLKQGDFSIPSPDEVKGAESGNGGWKAAQLAEWGIPWPPPKGWRLELERRWHESGAREGVKTQRRILHPRVDRIDPRPRRGPACVICGYPHDGPVITHGANSDGTLRVFQFCSAEHMHEWQAAHPFPPAAASTKIGG